MPWYGWFIFGFLIATYLFERHVRKGINMGIIWTIHRTERLLQRFDGDRE